jgi:hypothetical protein
MDIKDLEKGFNELQSYSDSQFSVIVDLQKEIARLESENKSLKSMLESNVPLLVQGSDLGLGISNEQLICETQIVMLKEIAITRQLTAEEAKKFQIFVDILQKYKKPEISDSEYSISKMSEEELLKAASVTS